MFREKRRRDKWKKRRLKQASLARHIEQYGGNNAPDEDVRLKYAVV